MLHPAGPPIARIAWPRGHLTHSSARPGCRIKTPLHPNGGNSKILWRDVTLTGSCRTLRTRPIRSTLVTWTSLHAQP
jgi:hypothetical protein